MGSGKTTIGKAIAKALGINFIDLDDYISTRLESDISTIFETKGEIFFRKKEHELLREVLEQNEDFVLSTGGGTPCYAGNMKAILAKTPMVFYLNVPIPEIQRRLLEEKQSRPLIQRIKDEDLVEFIGKHLFERSAFYSMATNTIFCGKKSVEAIVNEILDTLS